MFITVSTLLLGIACGIGATVYVAVAVWNWRRRHHAIGFWYIALAVAYLACTTIIAGRQLGYFDDLPQGTSLLLLAPIIGIPPAIHWMAWLKARRLIREQRVG